MKNENLLQKFAKGKQAEQQQMEGANAVAYTRVSSKEQAENNMSLETQKKYVVDFSGKNKLKVLSYFGGTYESAQTDERNEFNRMIRYVKNSKEKISYILVYSLDRFSRSGENAIYIASELKRLGIQIVSVTQPIDTSTHTGALQQNIQFIFSKYDNDLRRQKCVDGMREKLRRGEWLGNCPIGYKYEKPARSKDQRVIVDEYGAMIKKAFLWRANDNISHTAIAENLTKKGLKIDRKTLTHLFRNPFYCGYISHNLLDGEIVRGKHEALVTEEVFLRVNNILKKNAQGFRWNRENENLPLRHFVKCAHCGIPYTGYLVKKKNLYYYKCATTGCKCNRSAKKLEGMFQNLLSGYNIGEDYYEALTEQMRYTYHNLTDVNTEEKIILRKKLNEVIEKLNKVEERFAYGEIERDIYLKVSEKLHAEKKGFEEELDKVSKKISNPDEVINFTIALCRNLVISWGKGELHQKVALQNLIFPAGIQYDRKKDELRTDTAGNIFRRIASFPSDYNGNKKEKLDWTSNFSDSVARMRIELMFPP